MNLAKISRARTCDSRGWVGSSVDMSMGRISVAKVGDIGLIDRMRSAVNAESGDDLVLSNFSHNDKKPKAGETQVGSMVGSVGKSRKRYFPSACMTSPVMRQHASSWYPELRMKAIHENANSALSVT